MTNTTSTITPGQRIAHASYTTSLGTVESVDEYGDPFVVWDFAREHGAQHTDERDTLHPGNIDPTAPGADKLLARLAAANA